MRRSVGWAVSDAQSHDAEREIWKLHKKGNSSSQICERLKCLLSLRPGELVVTVALDKPVVVTGKDLEVPESVLKERRFKDMAKVRPETRRS